jgi:hypothetical protein
MPLRFMRVPPTAIVSRSAGGVPSTLRWPAAAAHRQAWRGKARPGQADQHGVG